MKRLMNLRSARLVAVAAVVAALAGPAQARPVPEIFTYQGELRQSGAPFSGTDTSTAAATRHASPFRPRATWRSSVRADAASSCGT